MLDGTPSPSDTTDVVRYYREATADYAAWSRAFHMHFGYYRRGVGFFDREAQLVEMSRQVLLGRRGSRA